METYYCTICGKPMRMHPSARAKRRYLFCSRKCQHTPFLDRTCVVCSNHFKVIVQNPGTKFCSKDCHNRYIRENELHKKAPKIEKICEHCGKLYLVRRSIGRTQRYCSQQCFGFANSKKGEANSKWKPKVKVTCAYCGKEFETYPCRASRKNYCCKAHFALSNLLRFANQHRTDIERAMANALMDSGIRYDEQVPMFGKFLVDFKLQDYPIIIQCDGRYWHDRPDTKARDKGQDNYFAKCGYTVLRFTDDQIYHDLQGCIRKIKQCLRAGHIQ